MNVNKKGELSKQSHVILIPHEKIFTYAGHHSNSGLCKQRLITSDSAEKEIFSLCMSLTKKGIYVSKGMSSQFTHEKIFNYAGDHNNNGLCKQRHITSASVGKK